MTFQEIRAIAADETSNSYLIKLALGSVTKERMLRLLKDRRASVRGEMNAAVHTDGRSALNTLYAGAFEKHALDHAIEALERQAKTPKGE